MAARIIRQRWPGSVSTLGKPLTTAQTLKKHDRGVSAMSVVMSSVAVGYTAGLLTLLVKHQWILKSDGRPVFCDFIAYWAAGRMALAGHAAAAYDPSALHAVQTGASGPVADYLYWNYPPFFFFVAILLASAPYLVAFLGWVLSSAAAYAATVSAIVRQWEGALAACASPVVLLTSFAGQNGFLSAALFGGSLLLLSTRPVLAGAIIGLLAYKPQFGLLLPIALIAGRHWRAFGAATATLVVLVGISAMAFGMSAWWSFFHALPLTSNAYLTHGGEGWSKLQSIYSVMRFLGSSNEFAWDVQIATDLLCAAIVIWVWRQSHGHSLKSSILVIATMLSTPYLHVYDFPLLLIAMAFLYRHRPFDVWEWSVVIAVNLLMLAILAQLAPIGPAIILLVPVIIVRRLVSRAQEQKNDTQIQAMISHG